MNTLTSDRPIVALTYGSAELDTFLHWRSMFNGIVAAGGIPLAIDCSAPVATIREQVVRCDALILSGGVDLDAETTGGDAEDPLLGASNPARDANEIAAFEAARVAGMPVLALCRGAQLVNVVLGGTLYVDLARDHPSPTVGHRAGEEALDTPVHNVSVANGSHLSELLGGKALIAVNSQHHQGIRELAPNASATARSDDGLIEGFEADDGTVIAVQWHPEVLWRREEHALGLLSEFIRTVDAASRNDSCTIGIYSPTCVAMRSPSQRFVL